MLYVRYPLSLRQVEDILDERGVSGLNLWSMLVAIFGAVVVLVIYHAVVRRRIV